MIYTLVSFKFDIKQYVKKQEKIIELATKNNGIFSGCGTALEDDTRDIDLKFKELSDKDKFAAEAIKLYPDLTIK